MISAFGPCTEMFYPFILHEGMNVDTEEGTPQNNIDILVDDTVIDTGKVKKKINKTITTEIETLK